MFQLRRFQSLFVPQSVAVVGASDRVGSRGTYVWNSVLCSGCLQKAYPVNPKYKYLGVVPCWSKLEDLPERVDLAVIATPSRTVMDILAQCAKLSIPNVMVMPGDACYTEDFKWRFEVSEFAKEHGILLLGPDSIGLARLDTGFNVNCLGNMPQAGGIALVSQTGSVCAQVLAYAQHHGIGFSSVISTGIDNQDVFVNAIEFLARDEKTCAIALEFDAIQSPRALASVMHAAADKKPVILLRHVFHGDASKLTVAHAGQPTGDDRLFQRLCDRCHVIRAEDIDMFCALISCVGAWNNQRCGNIGIITNGLGISVQASDALGAVGLRPAVADGAILQGLPESAKAPNPILNPLNLGEHATADQFALALRAMLASTNIDCVEMVTGPFPDLRGDALVQALLPVLSNNRKPILIVDSSHLLKDVDCQTLSDIGIAVLDSFAAAARVLAGMNRHQDACLLSLQGSKENAHNDRRNLDTSRSIVEDARSQKRHRLSQEEAFTLIRTFGIATARGFFAATAEEAKCVASRLGFPLAMKLCADGVLAKSDAQGILLQITADHDIKACFDLLRTRVSTTAPQAKFRGVFLQQFVRNPNARSLRLHVKNDAVFGPAISMGLGGRDAVLSPEVITELVPMTEPIARRFVQRAPFADALRPVRGLPAVSEDALVQALLYISRLVSETPAISELDINPLLVDDKGVLALDCSVAVSDAPAASTYGYPHLLFCPPPAKIERSFTLGDYSIRIRTLRPDDGLKVERLLQRLGNSDAQLFWHKSATSITRNDVTRLCSLNYDRAFALIAVDDTAPNAEAHAICYTELAVASDPFEAKLSLTFENGFLSPKLLWTLVETTEQDLRTKQVKLLAVETRSSDKDLVALLGQFGFAPTAADADKRSELTLLYKRL